MKTLPKNNYGCHHINGDIFEDAKNLVLAGNNGCSVIIPHVCNNINLFGAGFAAAVASHYPIVKENFHLLGNKAILGQTQFVSVYKDKKFSHQLIFANMIAQNGVVSKNNKRPLNYLALAKCMSSVSSYISQMDQAESRVQVLAPKFGSGLAGGNWLFIQDLITDIWNTYPVFVYSASANRKN